MHNLLTAAVRLQGVNGRPYLAVVMTCGMSLQPYMEDNKLRRVARCLWTKLLTRERWCKFMSNNLLTFHLRVGLATINSIAHLVDRALDSPVYSFAVLRWQICTTILPLTACDVKEGKKDHLSSSKTQTRYQCPVCRS